MTPFWESVYSFVFIFLTFFFFALMYSVRVPSLDTVSVNRLSPSVVVLVDMSKLLSHRKIVDIKNVTHT